MCHALQDVKLVRRQSVSRIWGLFGKVDIPQSAFMEVLKTEYLSGYVDPIVASKINKTLQYRDFQGGQKYSCATCESTKKPCLKSFLPP